MVFDSIFTVFFVQNKNIYTSPSHTFCGCFLYLKKYMKHNYIEKKDMSPPLVHCLFSRDQQLL